MSETANVSYWTFCFLAGCFDTFWQVACLFLGCLFVSCLFRALEELLHFCLFHVASAIDICEM